MIERPRHVATRTVATLVAALVATLALSACSGSGAAGPSRSATPSASASGTPRASSGTGDASGPGGGTAGGSAGGSDPGSTSGSAAGSGSASGSAAGSASGSVAGVEPGGTALPVTCDQLLTADQLYAFNPNFGDDPGYRPAPGSLAATAVADKGVACAYLNQTSGAVIQISVAQPDRANLTALENAAVTTSAAVPTYGVPQGYFSTSRGEAQVFTGPYWIAAVAPANTFAEPGDPAPLIQSIRQNLPAH